MEEDETVETALDVRPAVGWVVEVKDPGDLLAGIPPYVRRFTYQPDEAPLAWACFSSAQEAGFIAQVQSVKKV